MKTLSNHPNLIRAIQIAKTGNLKIRCVFDDTKEGCMGYPDAREDFAEIQKELKGVYDNFSLSGDMTVELINPKGPMRTPVNRLVAETWIDMMSSAKYKENKKVKDTISETSQGLLNTAIMRLGLSVEQVRRVRKVARAIAIMDSCTEIATHHIAEAIQYNCFDSTLKDVVEQGACYVILDKSGPVGVVLLDGKSDEQVREEVLKTIYKHSNFITFDPLPRGVLGAKIGTGYTVKLTSGRNTPEVYLVEKTKTI